MKALITAVALGLIAASSWSYAQPTDQERSQVFPKADFCRQIAVLNGEYFCEAWHAGRDGDADELLGHILIKTLTYRSAEMRVLVGVNLDGEISKIIVNGPESIGQEFLAQFKGKNLRSSFEIVKTPEDLLFVPAKIKAISGKAEICEEIARTVATLMKAALSTHSLTLAK